MNSLTHIILTYPDGASRLTALARVSLTAPDSGAVVVAGTDTAGMSRDEMTALRRRSVGTVFQQPDLIASLTAAEQLQTWRGPGRTSSPAASASG